MKTKTKHYLILFGALGVGYFLGSKVLAEDSKSSFIDKTELELHTSIFKSDVTSISKHLKTMTKAYSGKSEVLIPGDGLWVKRLFRLGKEQKASSVETYKKIQILLVYSYRNLKRKPQHAMEVACECMNASSLILKDHKLAVGIADTFLIPNLFKASPDWREPYGRQSFILNCIATYRRAHDTSRRMGGYAMLIHQTHSRNTADGARVRMAEMMDKQKKYREAIHHLDFVDPEGSLRGARTNIKRLTLVLMQQEKETR